VSWVRTPKCPATGTMVICSPVFWRPTPCNLSDEEPESFRRQSGSHFRLCPLRERTVRTCSPFVQQKLFAGTNVYSDACSVYVRRAAAANNSRCDGWQLASSGTPLSLSPRDQHALVALKSWAVSSCGDYTGTKYSGFQYDMMRHTILRAPKS